MNLVPFDPFAMTCGPRRSKSLQDWLLSDFGLSTETTNRQWAPAVDVQEEEERFVVTADVPGVNPTEIEVTIDGGVLTIKGERLQESTEEKKNFRRVERSQGSFLRRFSFPETVDAEGITAKGKNGVLEIVIPKKDSAVPRKIDVQ